MMRKLELPSGTWHYKIGASSAQIRGPGDETVNVGTHEINGRPPDDMGPVTPGDVRRYIESVVLGGAER